MDGQTDELTAGWMDGWMDAWMHPCMESRKEGIKK